MSAILNGSSSYLSLSGSGPDYPCLFTAWFNPINATHNGTLLAASNNGSGGLQALTLAARGDVGSDPVYAQATAGGGSSEASQVGFFVNFDSEGQPIPLWFFAAALFTSATSRKVMVQPVYQSSWAWSGESTTQRDISTLDTLSIGALFNSGATNFFNGRIARVALWSDIDPNLVDLTVNQLRAGVLPHEVWHSRDKLFFYQRLRGSANEPHDVGTVTVSNVAFSSADAPTTVAGVNDYSAAHFPWPDYGVGAGPLPGQRLAVIDSSGYLQLAGASDADWIGVTKGCGVQSRYQSLFLRNSGNPLRIEPTPGASFPPDSIAYAAAEGRVDDSGTIAIGTVTRALGWAVNVIAY